MTDRNGASGAIAAAPSSGTRGRGTGAITDGASGAASDLRAFRTALGRFATGITVITTRTPDGKREGLTANSFGALSLEPPLVLWSLSQKAPSLPSFQSSPYFAVNVLAAHQRGLSNHFARPAPDTVPGRTLAGPL